MGSKVSTAQNLAEHLEGSGASIPTKRLIAKFLPLQKIQDLYECVQTANSGSWFDALLKEMRVSLCVDERDFGRIPKSGPVLVVSNHPFGILDGAVLGALIGRARSDAKILTNFLLKGVTELQDRCIFVDPFDQPGSAERNRLALGEALLWLRSDHMLAIFRAGEVSHLQLTRGEVTDPKWNPMIARLARRTGAGVLPVFFRGRNSLAFHALVFYILHCERPC